MSGAHSPKKPLKQNLLATRGHVWPHLLYLLDMLRQRGWLSVERPKPQTLEKVGRNLSIFALIVMLWVTPSEKHVATAYLGAQILAVLGVVLRLTGHVRWRFWAVAVAGWCVSMGAFALVAEISVRATEDPLFTTLEILGELLYQAGALYFCAVLLFLSQFVYRPEVWGVPDRWMKTTLALAWVFGLVVVISAVCSEDHVESMKFLRNDFVPYLLVYMVIVETLHSWRHYRLVITTIFLAGILVTSISVMGRALYHFGGYGVSYELEKVDFLRVETIQYRHTLPDGTISVEDREQVRNLWPFTHANRLCSYALMIVLFVWLQFFVTRNWELKILVAISALVPFLCVFLTLTRGGWLALAAGIMALIFMLNWRSIWVFLLMAVLGWWFAPPVIRDHVKTIFDPATYFSKDGFAKEGTVGLRMMIWQRTFAIIGDHPWLGIGAGSEVFQVYFKDRYGQLQPGRDTTHAHNNLLEIAAESGLPALALFLAFMGAVTAQVVRAWRQTQRRTKSRCVVAGFFGLLVAIMVYGMSNTSLRLNLGMLIWVCFALMTLLPSIARAIPDGDEAPVPAPANTAAS